MLPDGTKFQGPAELRRILLRQPDLFLHTVAERMMTYALGRKVEPSDMPVVRRIVKNVAQNDYKLSSVVMGIVESAPFQMRTKLEAESTPVGRPNNTKE